MNLVIWGAGGCAEEYLRILAPEHRVVAVVDNNAARHGTAFHGIPVHPPRVLPSLDYDVLVIASIYMDEIMQQIEEQQLCAGCKVLSVHRNPVRSSMLTTEPHHSSTCPTDLLERMDNRRWFHKIEVAPGCFTPGTTPGFTEFLDYPQTQDLTGKRVLDIGAWDGVYTVMAERRGASVTAYDIQDPDHSGFNIVRELTNSKAQHIVGSVYDLDPQRHGMYDVVMYFGVFYHLFDPVRAFCNINRVLQDGGIMLFEGAILDHAYAVDATWQPLQDKMEAYTSLPLTYYTTKQYWNDWSTWFVPNLLCLQEWIVSAGFEVCSMRTFENTSRGFGLARKVRPPLSEHEVLQDKQQPSACV